MRADDVTRSQELLSSTTSWNGCASEGERMPFKPA